MINWSLVSVEIKKLKDNPKNPRQINKQQTTKLGSFIDKFGLIDKPIITRDFMIIGGHQRIRLLKRRGVKSVECWMCDSDLSQEQIDEMCVGLNLHQGQWDWDCLANEYDVMDLLRWGFSEEQLVGQMKEAEEIMESEQKQEKAKKKQECPNCGCEF